MKQKKINGLINALPDYWIFISVACFCLILNGCALMRTTPAPRFYVLRTDSAVAIGRAGGGVPNPVNSAVFIGVGPVKIPEYHNRPQMVTQDKEKMIKFAQFDRWGESLNIGMERIIGEGLLGMLPGAQVVLYPWNQSIEVKYKVVIDIIRFDSELDKDLLLVAQWMVIDVQDSETLTIKRSEFRKSIIPQTYSGLAKTLSSACVSLSKEIAEELELILNEKKDVQKLKE